MKTISHARTGPASRFALELGLGLILGTLSLSAAFALMLRCGTAPATAFAYLLFFTTLRSITTLFLTRERAIQFLAASILSMAASFWALDSTSLLTLNLTWERHDASIYSIAWRSAVILICVLAVPRCASYLAARSLSRLRLAAARPANDIAID